MREQNKGGVFSDDLGSRSPVVQKPLSPEKGIPLYRSMCVFGKSQQTHKISLLAKGIRWPQTSQVPLQSPWGSKRKGRKSASPYGSVGLCAVALPLESLLSKAGHKTTPKLLECTRVGIRASSSVTPIHGFWYLSALDTSENTRCVSHRGVDTAIRCLTISTGQRYGRGGGCVGSAAFCF